ncbi:hypothetical protein J2X36_000241 [Methylobacterium sp. BE186]|uniref:hypothetical protein n=1 Tax=Methylobacterium sp. BE186 TaxID=2817715 RepID=UPI002856DEA4|nr:hypothetical protein [Methylobacterium sp. BE186]MDR7035506.1 hypothetical protein [Methylobacterium sp. BE186]
MNRLLLALTLLCALAAGPARAEIEPGDLTLTVTPERNGNADPFAREMVLLRIHGVYKQQILLEEVVQPTLANFSWTQLGRDIWSRTKLPDGQSAIAFDRVIAIFPHHAGDFTLDPFVHRLTLSDAGVRKVVDVRSAPISLPVATWKGAGGPDAKEPWWLPARDVSITDSWSPDPETLKVGESARRIVTVEAQGMVAEGLPPRPVMRTRGILTFAGPVNRETIITPQGPVARATYQWDVKPAIDEIIPLNAITISWFDTVSRTMREAEIPARQIGGGLPDREGEAPRAAFASPYAIAAAGLAAFGLGLALLGYGVGGGARLRLGAPSRRALRRAAAAGDATAFRSALGQGLQAEPGLAPIWQGQPETATALAALDRAVYAPGGSPAPDLRRLAARLSRPVRQRGGAPESDPLKPLDGVPAPP